MYQYHKISTMLIGIWYRSIYKAPHLILQGSLVGVSSPATRWRHWDNCYLGKHRWVDLSVTQFGQIHELIILSSQGLSVWARNWKRWDTCLTKLKKVRHMSHQAEKGETHVSPSWDTCLTKLKKVRHSPSWKGDWDTSNTNAKIKGGSNRSV